MLLPYYLLVSKDLIIVLTSIISGFALWIAIAMFVGSKKGGWWANVYLWFSSISPVGIACVFLLSALGVWKPFPAVSGPTNARHRVGAIERVVGRELKIEG